jgi:hypothetical protein
VGRLKRFLSRRVPPLDRIVLVESGDREIFEKFLPAMYGHCPRIDVVTCFGSPPASFDASKGRIYDIAEYRGPEERSRLYTELWQNSYSAVGIICAEQPIMTKWKWAIAAQLPGKLFIINENVDWFWVDRGNWKTVRHFVLYRAGLSGADAVGTLTQLAVFPFTVLYLLLWAGWANARRWLRTGISVR